MFGHRNGAAVTLLIASRLWSTQRGDAGISAFRQQMPWEIRYPGLVNRFHAESNLPQVLRARCREQTLTTVHPSHSTHARHPTRKRTHCRFGCCTPHSRERFDGRAYLHGTGRGDGQSQSNVACHFISDSCRDRRCDPLADAEAHAPVIAQKLIASPLNITLYAPPPPPNNAGCA